MFLLTTTKLIVSVKRVYSVNTYSWISTVLWGSERSEWVCPWSWMERAHERIKQAKWVKRSRALRSKWAEYAVPANIHSERLSDPFKTRLSTTKNALSIHFWERLQKRKMWKLTIQTIKRLIIFSRLLRYACYNEPCYFRSCYLTILRDLI